jgi:hypothetical protein
MMESGVSALSAWIDSIGISYTEERRFRLSPGTTVCVVACRGLGTRSTSPG